MGNDEYRDAVIVFGGKRVPVRLLKSRGGRETFVDKHGIIYEVGEPRK